VSTNAIQNSTVTCGNFRITFAVDKPGLPDMVTDMALPTSVAANGRDLGQPTLRAR
jgi:hypothetical protein